MSANMELVTSHQGAAHITVDQVKDLIAGMSGDVSGIKIFKNLDDALDYEVTGIEQVTVKTGQGLAGGYHFQLTDAFEWNLDPGTVGYSRIDMLYLVIYEDSITTVQSVDLVYEVGVDYPNGTSGTVPDPPTGTNIKETFAFLRADITDGAITLVSTYGVDYISNSYLSTSVTQLVEQLEQDVGGTVTQVQANTEALDGARFGKNAAGKWGYYEDGADTVTPFRSPKGNAAAGDVLAGKTFANATDDQLNGSMPNRGAMSGTVNPGGTCQIPAGYHNGSGKVTGNQNTGTFAFPAGSGGNTVDMGASNLYRYANAEQVRVTGQNDKRNMVQIGTINYRANNPGGTLTLTIGGTTQTFNFDGMGFGDFRIFATVGYNNGVTNGQIV